MSVGNFCQISERDILTVANKIDKSEIFLIEHTQASRSIVAFRFGNGWIWIARRQPEGGSVWLGLGEPATSTPAL